MSNVIKTYNIRYEEKAKKIDSNERAEQLIREYIEKNGILPLGAEENPQSGIEDAAFDTEAFIDESLADEDLANGSPEDEGMAGAHQEAAGWETDEDEDGFVPGINAAVYSDEEDVKAAEADSKTVETDSKAVVIDEELLLQNDEYLRQQAEMKKRIEEESAKILEDAKTEVKRLMAQAVTDAEDEKNRLFEEARKEGYNTGFNDGLVEIDKLKSELEEQNNKRIAEYEKQVQNIEPAFVDIVISLVQKLTGVEAEDNKEIIFHLIHQAILNQAASNSYIIRVSKPDYDYVFAKKDSLLGFMKKGAVVEILEDHLLGKNQCLIETDSRIIDCSLDVQLKNLIKDLKMLA